MSRMDDSCASIPQNRRNFVVPSRDRSHPRTVDNGRRPHGNLPHVDQHDKERDGTGHSGGRGTVEQNLGWTDRKIVYPLDRPSGRSITCAEKEQSYWTPWRSEEHSEEFSCAPA